MFKFFNSDRYNNIRLNVKVWYLIILTLNLILCIIPSTKFIYVRTRTVLEITGAVLLAVEVFTNKVKWYKPPYILQVAFMVSYCITVLINRMNYSGHIMAILYMLVFVFLCGIIYRETPPDKLKKLLVLYCRCFIIMLFIGTFISLYFFLFDKMFFLTDKYGTDPTVKIQQGWSHSRLFGIFREPNHIACYSLCSILMTLWLKRATEKKRFWSIFYIVNIVVQIIYFLLTNSRSGLVALFAMMLAWGLCAVLRQENRVSKKKLIKTIAFVLAALLLVIPIRFLAQKALGLVQFGAKYVVALATGQPMPEYQSAERIPYNSDFSTHRVSGYIAAIKTLFKHNYMFGLGHKNIEYYVNQDITDEQTIAHRGMISGSAVKMLASSGIIGSVLICTFLGYCAIGVIKVLSKSEIPNEQRPMLEGAAICVAGCLAASLFLEDLFFNFTPTCVLFWGGLAICIYFINMYKSKKQSKEEKAA